VAGLSVERFLEVADTKKRLDKLNKSFKSKLAIMSVMIIWIFAFLFSLPIVLSIDLVELVDDSFSCETTWNEVEMNSFFLIKFIVIFILPFTVILYSSIRLLIFLNEQKNSYVCQAPNIQLNDLAINNLNETTRKIKNDETKPLNLVKKLKSQSQIVKIKAIKIVLSIVLLFFLQWVSNFLLLLYKLFE
jgi:hypothetical protein